MKKDIEIPIVKNVYVAIVREWNEEFLCNDWNAYIINDKTSLIEMVMVVSQGFSKDKMTSKMRHGIGVVPAKSAKKIELIQEDVLTIDNEFSVTFFADDKLYEKKYVFKGNTVKDSNLASVLILDKEGVLAK